jgi:hypothetical protein
LLLLVNLKKDFYSSFIWLLSPIPKCWANCCGAIS